MMVKKIRQKFMLVSILLMALTIGFVSFFIIYSTLYWEERERIVLSLSLEDDFEGYDDYEDFGKYKPLSDFIVISGGFLILLGASFLLSRFVTEPAEKALEREKQFISDASHELKTPLAAISINAQALQAELGENKHLAHILSETARMNSLVQKFLKLSYTEEAGKNIEKRDFSLSKACEEMVLTLESNIFERQINFDYEIAKGVFYFGNEDDIKQVLVILLDNAMKHTPKAGSIFFALKSTDALGKGTAAITVENSGEGISQKDLPHIFERFYRADKSRTANNSGGEDSYGLGLAIAKAILDAHGATISATSEAGRGARFVVKL